jgi:hypothetical protein
MFDVRGREPLEPPILRITYSSYLTVKTRLITALSREAPSVCYRFVFIL